MQEFLKIPVVLQSHEKLTGCLTILPVSVTKKTKIILKRGGRESGNAEFTTQLLSWVSIYAENSSLTVLNHVKETR